MKVAIVCFNLKWQAGGTRLIFSLAHGLIKLGNTVVIYAPEFDDKAFPDLRRGLDIRVIAGPRSFGWTKNPTGFVAKLRHKASEERLHPVTARRIAEAMDKDFDVVNPHDFAYKVGYFYKKINPRATVIWTENDPPYMYLPKENKLLDLLSKIFNRVKDFTEQKYFRAINGVVVLDFYNRDWATKRGLRPTVVRSGVDFDNFYAPVRDISGRGKTIRILGFGALNAYRRFEDIVRAAKLLRQWGYDARALIISKDIWQEAECRRKLLDLTKNEGMEPYITFRFEGVSNDELRLAYRESDVFVLSIYLPPPRAGYGWGLTNFEAMAAGLPLVICRTSTAMEVLVDGVHALAVEPANPEDIADKVKTLMDDPVLYRQIAGAGQKFVRENISWDKYAREMLKVFGGQR